jgi:uncharacterized repeat protein (TIGR01451 family)
VALGDIDRDGYPDIVAGSSGSGIGVWQSSAMGTGWAAQSLPTSAGSWRGIELGDVNDDGNLDIVAAADDDGVAVWTGDGAFGWTALTANPAASGDFWGLDLGDYNNDGALDVAAGTSDDKGILVWAGDGGTGWISYTTNLPTTGKYPAVRFGEIDNDGSLDLVGAKQGNGSVHAWTGAEGAPPSGWANFSPSGWTTTHAPMTLSIEVVDSGSGLNPNSAMYSTREGGAWSSWKPANCTGSPGVTTTQTISATGIMFTQDSGPAPHTRNQIRFRVSDMAGNIGYSSDETVRIDATAPTNPTSFPDSSHWPGGGWRNLNEITVENWTGDADATSGVNGFSYVFSTTYEMPDTTPETGAVYRVANSGPLPDGEWYIYMRTRDVAGNWATGASFDGPYRIDTGPPTNPTGFDSSHAAGIWSNDNTIYIEWSGAADTGSGVQGYGFSWTEAPLTSPDEILDTTESYTTSPARADGNSWYFHIKTVDRANNWTSGTVHQGPFYIDTVAPTTCSITSPDESSSSSFLVTWSCMDGLSGMDCYDIQVRDGASGSWTAWRTCTTGTSATYTGAQNAHTYYFRVRGHDRAGNVSGYLDEDHTVVQLPPVTGGFTPTSGFASAGQDSPPLQLVPGTVVTITGSSFTGGTVYFNGVAMEPTLSQVVNDSQIRAVIGVGTPTGSGPVCVRTPGGENCSADDFEVVEQPFPVRWGSGFDNFSTPAGDMSWGIFEEAFGTCSTHFCPIPNPLMPWRFLPCSWCPHSWLVRRPEARIFYNATRDVADGGDCYGFSYLTMDYMRGTRDPDDYAAGADVPASLMFTAPNLADAIRARQWRQKSLEAQLGLEAGELWFNHNNPLEFRDAIQGHLDRGERVMICLSDHDDPRGYRGHCVNPYAVDGNLIRIYDNNWSYIVDGDAAMERAIEVHADSWSYGSYGDSWPDDDNTMQILPHEIADGPNTIPSDVGRFIFGSSEAGHFSIRDSEGNIIGYDDTGQYTRTITSAHPVFPRMGISQTIEGYYLSEPGEYTLHISGTASGAYSATIFSAAGAGLAIEGVSMTPGARDEVTFELPISASLRSPQLGTALADGGNFVIGTSDAGKAATLTLFRQGSGEDEQRTYTMEGVAFDSGSPLSVTTESGADALVIAGGSGSTYDVCFYSQADGQMPAEFCWSGIAFQAGDRHILTPEDWSRLNATRVQLEIDTGNDGSIDETQWLVGHGLILTMQSEPAVIQSGDRITYTLAYTVTGEEVAPNVVLSTSVPISTTFVSATGGVEPVDDVLTWALGDLTPPTGGQVTFVVQVDPVPNDVVLGTIAYLQDGSGRWAMASSASAGPNFGLYTVYLPLVLRDTD